MVCVHGFTDTWRSWELVLPELEQRHDVLAPTLAGHTGGPAIAGEFNDDLVADAVEQAMDEAGFETAHIVGNSLGGFVALQLAERGRAKTVVALAPAGGWAEGDPGFEDTLTYFKTMQELLKAAVPHAEQIVATPEGRRRATEFIATNYEHIPPELLVHQMRGAASCEGFLTMIEVAIQDEEEIDCSQVLVHHLVGHDQHGHPVSTTSGCTGTIQTSLPQGHEPGETSAVFVAVYTDPGGLSGSAQVGLDPAE